MRTLKRHLQFVDAVAATSPSHPRPSLARYSQDHRFDIQNLSPQYHKFDASNIPLFSSPWKISHYIEFGGLTTM
jgi:hypothetical protein